MWLSLKVTALLIVSLQPAGRRMRPSFGPCYVARSGADMLEKLNLGAKQAQCYTPGQDSLCYETAGESMPSTYRTRYSIAAKPSPPEWEALPSHSE